MLSYPQIDPILVRLGPVSIRWYGMMYLIGFCAGWLLGRYRASRPGSGWTALQVDDLITYLLLGVILGGRLGYALFYDLPGILADPVSLVKIWQGGMSFHGGFLGVLAAIWFFCRKYGKTFGQVADFTAPLAPLGLFVGRLGNFINGELWGKPSTAPWAMIFPDPRSGGIPRHPSQLYEASLEGLALFCILWFYSAKPRPTGAVAGLFCVCYGIFRFTVEFFRVPDPQLGYLALGWVTMGQLLSLPLIAFGIWLLLRPSKTPTRPIPGAAG
jgi:phosphatidylglycerol---prolipoprotein diacylglyceryl transferase